MESKKNTAVKILELLGVYAQQKVRITLKNTILESELVTKANVKKSLKSAQKKEIARLRIEQKYYEFKLTNLTKQANQKIAGVEKVKTIEGIDKKEYLNNIALDILSIKKQIKNVRGF